MTQILIVEDERPAAEELEELLLAYDPTFKIAGRIESVKAAVEWLSSNSCDLIFMDIHLADDISFNIFQKIKVLTPVIFCTAYDQYAIKAFTVNSIDYLLKPVDSFKLVQAMDKFKELKTTSQTDLSKMLEAFKSMQPQYQKRFIVHSGEKIISIQTSDIGYFFAQQRYVILFTKNNEQYIIDYTLDKLDQVLDPEMFFRINRQFIISFDVIKNMAPYAKGRIKIETEPTAKEDVIVSIDRASRFKDWLNR
jgi:two-component system response regulator LytT